MQLNSADSREEDGTDYRDSIVSGRYLSGTSGYLRRISGTVWSEAENRTGDKSQKSGRKRKLYGGVTGMINVNSIINLNFPRIKQLTQAQSQALEQTAEALHTEVVQAQVFPFDTGNLQNESTFVDCSESSRGQVTLASTAPYARRVYFHPEYHFQTKENPNARGLWYEDWLPGGSKDQFCQKAYKEIYRRIVGL